jgi:hypothetical protein
LFSLSTLQFPNDLHFRSGNWTYTALLQASEFPRLSETTNLRVGRSNRAGRAISLLKIRMLAFSAADAAG